MLDLPVLFPLAALKPATTGPDTGVAPAPAAPLAGAAPVAPATLPASDTGTLTAGTVTAAGSTPPATSPADTKPSPLSNMLPLLFGGGLLLLFYLFMIRPQKKAEKDRKSLLTSMKKGDRVMTIGGLVARVVSIDEEDVVLKIDESANVKATFKKSSVQQILDRDDKSK